MQGNRRDKLKSFLISQTKAYKENVNEVLDELHINKVVENPRKYSPIQSISAILRNIKQSVPDSTRKWLKANGHGDLWEPYKNWTNQVAFQKNKLASKLANELGLDLEKEHPISVAGAGDIPPKTPYSPVSDRGPDTEGFTGSGKYNRRMGKKNSFARKLLQKLGIATNWQESVANFVIDRPDIKNPKDRTKLGLKPLPVRKPSNLGLLKVQQGDLSGDALEQLMDLEYDLKKSGIISNKNDEALLNNYLKEIDVKETTLHADKHSWLRDKNGELILDNNNKPIPTGQWDLEGNKPFRASGKLPDGSTFGTKATDNYGPWYTKRLSDSKNAVKRQNPIFTKLATEVIENGDNGTNGKTKTNGLNIGKGIGTRKLDNAINLGVAVGTGNYGQAAVSAMSIGAAETLKSKAAQKFAAEQMIKIGAKRGGKTALKLIPGVDIAISAQEAWSYLRQGKLDQAGIAALSGAVGWVPIVGDAASAGLDLTNTGIDIARLHVNNTDKNKKKLETDTPTKSTVRRAKIKY